MRKQQRHRTPNWAQPGRTVTLNPRQMAAAGIHEPISIVLPAGFDSMSEAQRQAWASREMHAEVNNLLAELLP